jgi:2-keto-myo-inositol isomerase
VSSRKKRRDYSLTGPESRRAQERGLVAAQWYTCPIPRQRLKTALAFEFVGYPNCSVNTFGQAYDIVQAADRDNVGIVLDCFHFHAMNSRLEDLRQADPNKIFVFHIDDCEDLPVGALRDHHRVWPGHGCVDLDAILGTLKEIGYREMVSVELFRPEYWDWDIERTIRTGIETTESIIRSYFPVAGHAGASSDV